MREAVQEPPCLNMLHLQHKVAITTSGRRSHDVLVERKWYEDNDYEEVYDCAHGTHRLWSVFAITYQQYSSSERCLVKALGIIISEER